VRRDLFSLAPPLPGAYTPRSSLCWPPTYPHWGFPLPGFAAARGGEKRESGEREGGAGRGGRTRDTASAPRPEAAPVAARKEGFVRVRGEDGPEQGPECRRERLRGATVFPEPATTTPSTHREHPAAIFFFPSSLDAFQYWTGDVEARRWEPYPACVLAIESQYYRPATGLSSWALHAPELTVAAC
jgi:hypothetical protein